MINIKKWKILQILWLMTIQKWLEQAPRDLKKFYRNER